MKKNFCPINRQLTRVDAFYKNIKKILITNTEQASFKNHETRMTNFREEIKTSEPLEFLKIRRTLILD